MLDTSVSVTDSPEMFSSLIPGLNSVHSPDEELFSQIPASLQSLFKCPNQFLSFNTFSITFSDGLLSPYYTSYLRRPSSYSGESIELRTLIVWFIAATVFTLASLSWLIQSNKKRMQTPLIAEAIGESSESYGDALFDGDQGSIDPFSDDKSAEELQVQEALLVSLFTSQIARSSLPLSIQASANPNPKPVKITNEVGESSRSFCNICLETKEIWQMFGNEKCSHSFCYECTSNHIVAKIQDNNKVITCPGVNCNAILESDVCRLMIPKDVLVRWDESLCRSLINESQIIYCPYQDCSAMLVNDDSGEIIREITCPICRRSMCASCRVPWHSEFDCEEFQKLSGKKKGGEDSMVKELAKKKKWSKCPNCKYYVEKIEGCLHITCRCGYEFCYKCGSKWSVNVNHGGCCQRS